MKILSLKRISRRKDRIEIQTSTGLRNRGIAVRTDSSEPDIRSLLIRGSGPRGFGTPEWFPPFSLEGSAGRRQKNSGQPSSIQPGKVHRRGTSWDGDQALRSWVGFRR